MNYKDSEIRKAAIKECSDLLRRWADNAAEFKDERAQLQANVCRSAVTAIDNLKQRIANELDN